MPSLLNRHRIFPRRHVGLLPRGHGGIPAPVSELHCDEPGNHQSKGTHEGHDGTRRQELTA
jgi:hypothetical protein